VSPQAAGPTAFAAALALLTGRSLTVGELGRRLRRKGFDPASVAEASGRLAELGLLDDRRAAAAWAGNAVQARGLGPRRLREGLAKRLLPRELIEETVADFFGSGEEARLASAALGRWERVKGPAVDPESRRAAYAHLRRRGFSGAAVRAALFNSPEIE
jgi:SOS response regulatory protein OraA/RecX